MGISLKIGTFTPNKLVNTTLASYYSRNFDFLVLQTAHFDKSIILPFLVVTLLDFYFLYFFYTLN